MRINRRAFIQGATLVATTPALAALFPLSPTKQASALASRSSPARESNGVNCIVFKIDGWDFDAKDSNENEVLIRINQFWRAAWR